MNNNILLSICIPTYNRCDILDQTLSILFANPDFDERIEVIVSDNCSTDKTADVVAKYAVVRYYRNETNIRDCNYSRVLSYARGKYIKLFNDTLHFLPGVLGRMLTRIEQHCHDNKNLFFYSNVLKNIDCCLEIDSQAGFLKEVTYFSTWIANFGVWRSDFERLSNKDRYAELQFAQVDWSYKLVSEKSCVIYFENMFEVVTPNKKGGYNIFDVFINKYLYIIKQQDLSKIAYEREKYRLCRYFISPWLITLLITNRDSYNFDINKMFRIIFKKYWYEPYLYLMFFIFLLKKSHK